MNAHEVIDRISSKTPRQKIIGSLVIVGVLVVIALGFMYAGYRLAHRWSDSAYLENEKKRDKQITDLEASAAQHEKNETQLAAQNSLLKKQNEATAQILEQRDKTAAVEAAKKLTELNAERAKRFDDIDADANYDDQICGLCADAAKSGFPLSKDFCKRCEGK